METVEGIICDEHGWDRIQASHDRKVRLVAHAMEMNAKGVDFQPDQRITVKRRRRARRTT